MTPDLFPARIIWRMDFSKMQPSYQSCSNVCLSSDNFLLLVAKTKPQTKNPKRNCLWAFLRALCLEMRVLLKRKQTQLKSTVWRGSCRVKRESKPWMGYKHSLLFKFKPINFGKVMVYFLLREKISRGSLLTIVGASAWSDMRTGTSALPWSLETFP